MSGTRQQGEDVCLRQSAANAVHNTFEANPEKCLPKTMVSEIIFCIFK